MKRLLRRALTPRLTSRSFFWHKSLLGGSRAAEMRGGNDMGAGETHQNGSKNRASFLERTWTWLHATFPERQIYIRSDGRVQFFTFGPSLQATLAGLTLIFLGWVAVATVNVIFKDRIIPAKDHRYQQMQSAYENRVADLQSSYDDLNGALVAAEDRFKSTADALENKQNAIAGFLRRETEVEGVLGKAAAVAAPPTLPKLNLGGGGHELTTSESPASDSLGPPQESLDSDGGSSQLVIMPGPVAPQPRTAKPDKASLLERAWKQVATLFSAPPAASFENPAVYTHHPGL